MTLRQLQAFILTCELGSFTRTGERMLITQSAVTLLIKQLERDLGVTLFDRTTRALRLTSAANEALPIARRMLRNQELLTDSLRALADGRSGQVMLAVTVGVAAILMPRVVVAFRSPQSQTFRQFAVRPLVEPSVSRGLSIMTRKGRSLSHAARAFIEVTRQTVGG